MEIFATISFQPILKKLSVGQILTISVAMCNKIYICRTELILVTFGSDRIRNWAITLTISKERENGRH